MPVYMGLSLFLLYCQFSSKLIIIIIKRRTRMDHSSKSTALPTDFKIHALFSKLSDHLQEQYPLGSIKPKSHSKKKKKGKTRVEAGAQPTPLFQNTLIRKKTTNPNRLFQDTQNRMRTQPSHRMVQDCEERRQVMENRTSIRKAQKELKDRLKRKVLKNERRGWGMEKSASLCYRALYQDMQKGVYRSSKIFGEHLQLGERACEQSECLEDGRQYYSEIKDHPAILEYLKRRHRENKSKEQERKKLQCPADIEMAFLNLLKKRKEKDTLPALNLHQTQQDIYETTVNNIDQISRRMNKIYRNRPTRRISEDSQEELPHRSIRKKQEKILGSLHHRNASGQAREDLIGKFSEILKEGNKREPSKKEKAFKLQCRLQFSKQQELKSRGIDQTVSIVACSQAKNPCNQRRSRRNVHSTSNHVAMQRPRKNNKPVFLPSGDRLVSQRSQKPLKVIEKLQ